MAVAAAQKNREMFAIKKSYSIEVSYCGGRSCLRVLRGIREEVQVVLCKIWRNS